MDHRAVLAGCGPWWLTRSTPVMTAGGTCSAAERRRAEEAFATGRDCVIVATWTLEVGIDVGDLDRMIQLDASRMVAPVSSGWVRTGRRSSLGYLELDGDLAVIGAEAERRFERR